jgi:hypothetical protein
MERKMDCARWNFEATDSSLLVCRDHHDKGDDCDYRPMHPAEVLELVNDLRSRLLHLRVLIDNDSAAATFQTMGQYRAALLRVLNAQRSS